MKDFIFLNVKDLLERKFWRADDGQGLLPDVEAASFNRIRLLTQLNFMFENGLMAISRPATEQELFACSIRFSDLSDIGRLFVFEKCFEKWFRRMDRNPAKHPPSDDSFLRSELSKIMEHGVHARREIG